MKRIFTLILAASLMLTACSNHEEKKANQAPIPDSAQAIVQQADTFITGSTPESPTGIKSPCNCPTYSYPSHLKSDIQFQDHSSQNKMNEDLLAKWSNDTLRLKVTSLKFIAYDTIPDKFKIFENVEQVIIMDIAGTDWKQGINIYGLDIFPKLKTVTFWGSSIKLDPAAKWLKKIKRLHAEKTFLEGINNFSVMPDLRVLYLAHSGFKEFPKNIGTLKCLSELTLGANRSGKINLAEIDLEKLPCLKKLECVTWSDELTGIPQGLETSNLQIINISHPGLTAQEKEKIKAARH